MKVDVAALFAASPTCRPASSTAAAAPVGTAVATAAAAGAAWAVVGSLTAGRSVNLPFLSICFRKGMKEMPIMYGCSTSGTLE